MQKKKCFTWQKEEKEHKRDNVNQLSKSFVENERKKMKGVNGYTFLFKYQHHSK